MQQSMAAKRRTRRRGLAFFAVRWTTGSAIVSVPVKIIPVPRSAKRVLSALEVALQPVSAFCG